MKNSLMLLVADSAYFFMDILSFKKNKATPSLLAYNVHWFTNCNWVEQLVAFDQINDYITYKF